MNNKIIANVKWYSEETDEGWIDSETADRIFPDGCWEQLGYDCLDEYTNSYGMVFTYITPCHRSRLAKVSRSYDNSALHLSEADSKIFIEAMINPPKPFENLRRLLHF